MVTFSRRKRPVTDRTTFTTCFLNMTLSSLYTTVTSLNPSQHFLDLMGREILNMKALQENLQQQLEGVTSIWTKI